MDELVSDLRNGASWTRDCLLDQLRMAEACDRLQMQCRGGIRHFSALGRAVPLDEARKLEIEISRLESEADAELGFRSSISGSLRRDG
ncbi:MAG TPA: hypothetical protein VN325_34860 [Steroidobacteraceae bacterium]|nr:hypothetical protein [Steroidobacteraceae bacterium]